MWAARVTAPFISWTASMNIFGVPAWSACRRRTLLSHDAPSLTHTIPQHLSSPLHGDRGPTRRMETAPLRTTRWRPCRQSGPSRMSSAAASSLFAPGRSRTREHDSPSMLSLLNALTQTATNALDTRMLLEDLHRSRSDEAHRPLEIP